MNVVGSRRDVDPTRCPIVCDALGLSTVSSYGRLLYYCYSELSARSTDPIPPRRCSTVSDLRATRDVTLAMSCLDNASRVCRVRLVWPGLIRQHENRNFLTTARSLSHRTGTHNSHTTWCTRWCMAGAHPSLSPYLSAAIHRVLTV